MSEKKIQTCDTCKVRHQKCDGLRPTCHHCKLRSLECVYSTYSAKPRGTGALASVSVARSKRGALSGGRSLGASTDGESLELDVTLGTLSENGRLEGILRKELADLDISSSKKESLVKSIKQQLHLHAKPSLTGTEVPTDSKPTPLDAVSTDNLIQLIATSISGRSRERPTSILEELPALDELPFVPVMVPVTCGHSLASTPVDQTPTREEARNWLDVFLNGPNTITPVVAPDVCRDLLDRFYGMSGALDPKQLCLITYVLATGARYSDHVAPEIYLQWIHRAHCQLEYCLNKTKGSELWILQPLLLRCLISVHTSPSTAWLILGMACRIAQLYRIDQEFEAGGPLNTFEHEQWQQLWGSIVYLDVWLSVILGRQPSVNTSNSRYALLRNISSAIAIPESSFQNNVARLGVLLGLILRDIYSVNDASPNMYEFYYRLLETWAEGLPSSLRFQPSDSGKSQSKEARTFRNETGSRYLELMYLNNLVILTQPLVQARAASYAESKFNFPADSWPLTKTCIDAAARIGAVSAELGRNRAICKRAWLVSTMNFHAALLLLLFLASQDTSVPPNASSTHEHALTQVAERGITAAMQVLQFCGRSDPYANHLHKVMHILQSKVGAPYSHELAYDAADPTSAVSMDGYLSEHYLSEYGHAPNGITRRGMRALGELSFSPADAGAYSSAPSSAGISQPFTNLMSQQTTAQASGSNLLGAEDPYDLSDAASYYQAWQNAGFSAGLPPHDPHEGHDQDYHMQ